MWLTHNTVSLVTSKSLNTILEPSHFESGPEQCQSFGVLKETWCGRMQKNSTANRAHLHNFHQLILCWQKGLLLIGLEQTEESVEDGVEVKQRTTGCSCLINQSRGDFVVLRATELTRSAGWLWYKQDGEGNMKRANGCTWVCEGAWSLKASYYPNVRAEHWHMSMNPSLLNAEEETCGKTPLGLLQILDSLHTNTRKFVPQYIMASTVMYCTAICVLPNDQSCTQKPQSSS